MSTGRHSHLCLGAKHKQSHPQSANEPEDSSGSSSTQQLRERLVKTSMCEIYGDSQESSTTSANSGLPFNTPNAFAGSPEKSNTPSISLATMTNAANLDQDILSWSTPHEPSDLLDLPDLTDSVPQYTYVETGVLPLDTIPDDRNYCERSTSRAQYTGINSISRHSRSDMNENTLGPFHDRSALHMAAENGHGQTVRLLLEHGLDASLQDQSGRTPLHLGAENGHESVVRVLIDAMHANLEQRDDTGNTALHLAVARGHHNIVHLLLSQGANISARVSEQILRWNA
jgi:hypothetical protein